MKYNIKTDVSLKGKIWADTIDQLVGVMFVTNWELYELCLSIGIMYDEQINSDQMGSDDYKNETRTVPRNVLSHPQNLSLLELMFQSALITTQNLEMNEDERLEAAFGDESSLSTNAMNFLTKFANAGVVRLNKLISDIDPVETMDSLATFLLSAYEEGVNVLDDKLDDEKFE